MKKKVLYKQDGVQITLIQRNASCQQNTHSSYLYRYPVVDVLSPISRRLGRLRRHHPGHNRAAQDIVARHRT